MKRLFDLVLGITLCIILAVPMLLIAAAVRLTSKGPSFYWSDRVGKRNKIFKTLYKTQRKDLWNSYVNKPSKTVFF